jgi:hypothetical protein
MGKKIDILDLLPAEAMRKVDELGYSFLQERGYDADGAIDSKIKRAELKKALDRKGEVLRYAGAVDNETKAILVWFELFKGKEKVAVSQGIKFLQRENESGEEREDSKN